MPCLEAAARATAPPSGSRPERAGGAKHGAATLAAAGTVPARSFLLMSSLSPHTCLQLSVAASALLVLASIGWVWHGTRALPADSRDGRSARCMAALFALGALAWLAYGLYTGYAALWKADALMLFAQQGALLRLPFLIGGLAWVAALLVTRVLRMLGRAGSA